MLYFILYYVHVSICTCISAHNIAVGADIFEGDVGVNAALVDTSVPGVCYQGMVQPGRVQLGGLPRLKAQEVYGTYQVCYAGNYEIAQSSCTYYHSLR